MTKDIDNIIKHHHDLKTFFDYPDERHNFLESVSPSTLNALKSLIKFTKNTLKKHHPHYHKKLMDEHGDKIKFLLDARDNFETRRRLKHINDIDRHNKKTGGSLYGGSFFGDIGHFFSHAASSVGHAFKHAYHAVKNVGEHAIHGIEHAGETVYHGVKDIGEKAVHGVEKGFNEVGQFFKGVSNDVVDVADVALDAIKTYGPDVLEKALPYIEKGLNIGAAALANSVVPGSGVFISQGLTLAEAAANPLIKSKIESLKQNQGSGLIGLAYRNPHFMHQYPEFLTQYPQDNLIKNAGISMY